MFSIVKKENLAQQVKLFIISAPEIAKKALAGQFVVVRLDETGERIPLTIADTDPLKSEITLVVQEVGYTTKKMGALNEGDSILDLVGPLGHPSHIENVGTVIGIGGGVGIAPLYPVLREFKKHGNTTISIIGARSKELLFWENRTRGVSDEIYITTDDGSYGKKALVTDPLKEFIQKETSINLVFAVGPTIMMKAVAETTRPYNIHTVVSLNPIMIDATGMCGGCRVSVGGETKFTCVDGPEFNAHQVDFDLLLHRQKMYLEAEQEHQCRLGN